MTIDHTKTVLLLKLDALKAEVSRARSTSGRQQAEAIERGLLLVAETRRLLDSLVEMP